MIVFPMAGFSSRFTKSGYKLPKFMLELAGRPLFYHTVKSFNHYLSKDHFVFVYRSIDGTENFIHEQLDLVGVSEDRRHLISLAESTSGQAETVALACRRLPQFENDPLLIFNIDTIRPNFVLPTFVSNDQCDGYLEVFEGEGSHWSFVEPVEFTNLARRVTEKVRISNLCSTGLYYFKRTTDFLSAYEATENIEPAQLPGGERYVAPLYNILIEQKKVIRFEIISRGNVLFSGTPDEYECLLVREQNGDLSLESGPIKD